MLDIKTAVVAVRLHSQDSPRLSIGEAMPTGTIHPASLSRLTLKFLSEAGEGNSEEEIEWMRGVLHELVLLMPDRIKLVGVRPFDQYIGPRGRLEIDGRQYNVWLHQAQSANPALVELWIENFPVSNTDGPNSKPGLRGTIYSLARRIEMGNVPLPEAGPGKLSKQLLEVGTPTFDRAGEELERALTQLIKQYGYEVVRTHLGDLIDKSKWQDWQRVSTLAARINRRLQKRSRH